MTTTKTDVENPQETEGPYTRPFVEFLQEQRKGALHHELSDALQTVINAVRETGKKGRVTITVSVSPSAKGTGMVIVSDDVRVVAPAGDRGASLYYVDTDGNLSRNDPNQQNLPLREVTGRRVEAV